MSHDINAIQEQLNQTLIKFEVAATYMAAAADVQAQMMTRNQSWIDYLLNERNDGKDIDGNKMVFCEDFVFDKDEEIMLPELVSVINHETYILESDYGIIRRKKIEEGMMKVISLTEFYDSLPDVNPDPSDGTIQPLIKHMTFVSKCTLYDWMINKKYDITKPTHYFDF